MNEFIQTHVYGGHNGGGKMSALISIYTAIINFCFIASFFVAFAAEFFVSSSSCLLFLLLDFIYSRVPSKFHLSILYERIFVFLRTHMHNNITFLCEHLLHDKYLLSLLPSRCRRLVKSVRQTCLFWLRCAHELEQIILFLLFCIDREVFCCST